ncbi:MAG: CHAD domain-containing protein, partial [Alphaproteobacteria bacterium]
METELKILLDAAVEAAIASSGILGEATRAARRPQNLVSVYYDTPGRDLSKAGIALRVRRRGRQWIQTVKRSRTGIRAGLSVPEELEFPVPSAAPVLDEPAGDALLRAVRKRLKGAAPLPVFETRMKRELHELDLPQGRVEIAIDRGEIVAGRRRAPLAELEIELKSGSVTAVFEAARRLLPHGPVRFSTLSKAARGFRLVETGCAVPRLTPRAAGRADYPGGATVEQAAQELMRDCLDQIAANMSVIAAGEDPEGPHQLRIGLRRLRTVLKLFGPDLGKAALRPFRDRAREIGRRVGALRDLDVLAGEILPRHLPGLADGAAAERLAGMLEARRQAARAALREWLAGREAVHFLFDLGEFIEISGWRNAAQPERDATPDRPVAERAAKSMEMLHAR